MKWYVFLLIFRYDLLMLSCWRADSKERLPFSDLVNAIEQMLTKVADYLDINEFTLAVDHSSVSKNDNTEKSDNIVDIVESSM